MNGTPTKYKNNFVTNYAINVNGTKKQIYVNYDDNKRNYVYTIKEGSNYYPISNTKTTAFNRGNLPTAADIQNEVTFGDLRKIYYYTDGASKVYSPVLSQRSSVSQKPTTNTTNTTNTINTTNTQNSSVVDSIANSLGKAVGDTLAGITDFFSSNSSDNPLLNGTLVGSYNTGNKTVQVYTDGTGNYYYSDGNKSVKITDPSKINFSNEYIQSVTAQNNPSYLSNTTVSGGATANAAQPRLMSAAELAALYGINYDYDYILNMLNEGTDMYLNEMTEKAKKLQGDSLRNQSALYQQYLDTLRAARANAVNTGINRGALAAQELGQYLLTQQQIGQSQSEFNSNIYDLYNQAITERAKNKETAYDKYNALGQALMSASANLNANDVQRYAADMAYASQLAYSNAYAKAAATSAQNNWDVAWLNSLSNPSNAWAAELYKKGQLASVNQANAQANYYNSQKKE